MSYAYACGVLGALGRAIVVGVLTHNDSGFGYQYVASISSYSAVSTWNRGSWHGPLVDKQYLCPTYICCALPFLFFKRLEGSMLGLWPVDDKAEAWLPLRASFTAETINDFYYTLSHVHTMCSTMCTSYPFSTYSGWSHDFVWMPCDVLYEVMWGHVMCHIAVIILHM